MVKLTGDYKNNTEIIWRMIEREIKDNSNLYCDVNFEQLTRDLKPEVKLIDKDRQLYYLYLGEDLSETEVQLHGSFFVNILGFLKGKQDLPRIEVHFRGITGKTNTALAEKK